jgi:hypothetical protein
VRRTKTAKIEKGDKPSNRPHDETASKAIRQFLGLSPFSRYAITDRIARESPSMPARIRSGDCTPKLMRIVLREAGTPSLG